MRAPIAKMHDRVQTEGRGAVQKNPVPPMPRWHAGSGATPAACRTGSRGSELTVYLGDRPLRPPPILRTAHKCRTIFQADGKGLIRIRERPRRGRRWNRG